MTRLLVSVRSIEEAEVARDGGADLIDVKEPSVGSLGAAPTATVREILRVVGAQAPVSAALGELAEGDAPKRAAQAPPGLAYAKFGLAGCRDRDWPNLLAEAIGRLNPEIAAVAVAYADWRSCAAPPPEEVLSAAIRLKCEALLIDTSDKSRGGLLAHWPWAELEAFCASVTRAGLLLVLAGGLRLADLPELAPLAPDFFAVRGAVCADDRRESTIDAGRIGQWRRELDRLNATRRA